MLDCVGRYEGEETSSSLSAVTSLCIISSGTGKSGHQEQLSGVIS